MNQVLCSEHPLKRIIIYLFIYFGGMARFSYKCLMADFRGASYVCSCPTADGPLLASHSPLTDRSLYFHQLPEGFLFKAPSRTTVKEARCIHVGIQC